MFIKIGTPQERDIVSVKDKNHLLPVHLQNVQDEQGRTRLHGAFQGGFSAGYFNTVGSKEGWEPTQFVSSRSNRQQVTSVPHDFMDKEDKQEFGHIKASKEYNVFENAAKVLQTQSTGNVLSHLSSFFSATVFEEPKEPIGTRMLKAMGWKKGELGSVAALIAKSDRHGLGFNPVHQNPDLRHIPKKKPVLKQEAQVERQGRGGFGIGIFEEEEEEFAEQEYDTVMFDEHDVLLELQKEKEASQSKANTGVGGYMEGFVKSKRVLPPPKQHTAPKPPAGFVPKAFICKAAKPGPETVKIRQGQTVFKKDNPEPKKAVEEPKKEKKIGSEKITPEVAQQALLGFMPFGDMIDKQARYRKYLDFYAGLTTSLDPPPAVVSSNKSLSREDAEHEPREFKKAAMIYRPLSEMISKRFSSEAKTEIVQVVFFSHKVLPVLIYGPDTHRHLRWAPDRVTCKRFGVGFTDLEVVEPADASEKEALNAETMEMLMDERDRIIGVENIQAIQEQSDEEFQAEDELVIPDLVVERPCMDLFKAIFADSDDEDLPVTSAAEISGQPFRPVFRKQVKKLEGVLPSKNKRPKLIASFEEEVEEAVVVKKKRRATAADFM